MHNAHTVYRVPRESSTRKSNRNRIYTLHVQQKWDKWAGSNVQFYTYIVCDGGAFAISDVVIVGAAADATVKLKFH